MNAEEFELPASVTWSRATVRIRALRLLGCGTDPETMELHLDAAMDSDELREIVRYLALFGFGAVLNALNQCDHSTREILGRALENALDTQGFGASTLAEIQDLPETAE